MDVRLIAGFALLAVVLILLTLHSFFAGVNGVPTGGTVLNFMGMPVYLHPVEGRDAPCIGAPDGYTRVFFEDQSGVDPDMSVSITVGYAREGDHLEEALSSIRARATACGFEKVSEQSAAFPGARGTSIQFSKGDEIDLTADAGVVTGNDGKEYTLIRIGYNEYVPYEEENVESSPPPAEEPEEVALPQNVRSVDEEIRPVLVSVFGSAYPTEYTNIGTSYGVVYHVGRYTTSDDAVAVSNALEERGWNVMATNNNGIIVEIGAMRDKVVLQVSFDLDTKKVDVLWVVQS